MKRIITWIVAVVLCLLMTGSIAWAEEGTAREQAAVRLPGETEDFDAQEALLEEYSREIDLLDRIAQLYDISYTEEELFISDKKVIQISANLLCRNQCGRKIYVFSLWEWRESLWYHRHLDVAGNLQLALH